MFKSLLLAALSVVSISAPAFALPVHDQIVSELQEAGVTVLLNTPCPDGFNGLYDSRLNILRVCADAEDPEATLVHESVHVLQDMKDGIMNNSLYTLVLDSDEDVAEPHEKEFITTFYDSREEFTIVLNHLVKNYPVEHFEAELEAYALQDEPHYVLGLLQYFNENSN